MTPKKQKPSSSSSDAAAPSSRRSQRKRKPREFADAVEPSVHADGGVKTWAHDDVVALLRAAIDFRDRTGSLPKKATMDEFFGGLKGLIDPQVTKKQVGFKLKRMKGKYANLGDSGLPATPRSGEQEQAVYELWKVLWASEDKGEIGGNGEEDHRVEDGEETEEEDEQEEKGKGKGSDLSVGNGEFPFIRAAMGELSKVSGSGLVGVVIEERLKSIDVGKAKALEGKLKKQAIAEARLSAKRLKLMKEIWGFVLPTEGSDA